jgi:hypothetical protein
MITPSYIGFSHYTIMTPLITLALAIRPS